MKVLVATEEGQGKRKNDFFWATGGELVHFPFECDGETVDGRCGCRRSMGGMESHKGTTTFKIVEKDISEADFLEKLIQSYKSAGWFKEEPDKDWKKALAADAKELHELAESLPLGRVIEKRGNVIQVRKMK